MITDFWGVRDGKLVQYKRSGECNQCGDCCKAGIYYTSKIGSAVEQHAEQDTKSKEDADWKGYEGWAVFAAQGIWWYFDVKRPEKAPEGGHKGCGSLTEEKGPCGRTVKATCERWMDETFRPICRYWPMLPEHVEWFPFCSFTFERVKEMKDGN